MASDSLNAKLAIEKGLYLASEGKSLEEATTTTLTGMTLKEKAFLIINLRPQYSIQVLGADPDNNDADRQWIEDLARESLREELSSI